MALFDSCARALFTSEMLEKYIVRIVVITAAFEYLQAVQLKVWTEVYKRQACKSSVLCKV